MAHDIITIGASAGGVEALPKLLGTMPADVPAAFFVALHISPHGESMLPAILERNGCLPAEHPQDRTQIRQGRIYIAPPDFHLLLEGEVIRLGRGPKENRHRPAIDPLFRSAAQNYGSRVAGVLLTGNLDDGVAGLRDIQTHGGVTIVQDPDEAAYPEMPCNALAALKIDHCLPLAEISKLVKCLVNSISATPGGEMKTKARGKELNQSRNSIAVEPKAKNMAPLVCPDCQGPLWEFRDGELLRYQCLVGHRYSLQSLLAAHDDEVEQALWIALRTLEERVNLQRNLASQAARAGHKHSGKMFLERSNENLHHAQLLQKILKEFARGRQPSTEGVKTLKR